MPVLKMAKWKWHRELALEWCSHPQFILIFIASKQTISKLSGFHTYSVHRPAVWIRVYQDSLSLFQWAYAGAKRLLWSHRRPFSPQLATVLLLAGTFWVLARYHIVCTSSQHVSGSKKGRQKHLGTFPDQAWDVTQCPVHYTLFMKSQLWSPALTQDGSTLAMLSDHASLNLLCQVTLKMKAVS